MGCFRVLVVSDLLTHIHHQIWESGQTAEAANQSGCILILVILLLLLLQLLVFLVQLLHSLLMSFSHFLVLQSLHFVLHIPDKPGQVMLDKTLSTLVTIVLRIVTNGEP